MCTVRGDPSHTMISTFDQSAVDDRYECVEFANAELTAELRHARLVAKGIAWVLERLPVFFP